MASAKAAADAAQRTAKATKIKGEVVLIQQKVTSAKKEFGMLVYEQMVAANRPEVERLFNETRTKIEAMEAQIIAKKEQIELLKVPTTPRGAAGAPGGPPMPPPGAPPSAPTGLPPGWRRTETAEGREYFYHEATGETSWTVPTA